VNFNNIEKHSIITSIIIIIIIIINYHLQTLLLHLYKLNKPYSYAIYCSSNSVATMYGTYNAFSLHNPFVQ